LNEQDGGQSVSLRSNHTHAPSSQKGGRTSLTLETSRESVIMMRSREGKPGGGKGPLLTPGLSLTLSTRAMDILFLRIGSMLSSGRAGFPARISASQEEGQGSMDSDQSWPSPSLTLWNDTDLTVSSLRMSQASSAAMPVETLGVSSVKWLTSGTGGPTEFLTLNGSECPSDESACSSSPSTLADILTPTAPQRYLLSAHAAGGIIKRSERRGRKLPGELAEALKSLALSQQESTDSQTECKSSSKDISSSQEWMVRRLTPLECERLMGWPDAWTVSRTWKRRKTSKATK
jgi:hypothetical protein